MRAPLFWAIRPGQWGRPDVVAVTTERGMHWWGRTVSNNVGTHGLTHEIRGRFDSQEAAEAMRLQVQAIRDHFHRQSAELSRAEDRLRHAERALTQQTIQGTPVRGAERLHAEVSLRATSDPVADIELYRMVFGDMTPEELEWSGTQTGPGDGPHGSGPGGTQYAACPVCRGLRSPNGDFVRSAVGHRSDCRLAQALGRLS